MDDNEIDADLIRRIGARDLRAIDALYDRHTATLHPVAARILRDRAAAEDAVQDSWLQIWRDAATYDERRGTVAAWLLSISRSRALDRAAALAARRNLEKRAGGADAGPGTDEAEDESPIPFITPSPALKGRVMATIQAGGAVSKPPIEAHREPSVPPPPPLASIAPSVQPEGEPSTAPTAPPAPSPPHYPRVRTPEPEPPPQPTHEAQYYERRGGFGWVGTVGWALAVLLAIVAGTLFESTGRLRAIISARNNEVNDLHRRNAIEERWSAILGFPGARVIEMTRGPDAPAGLRGRAIYAPGAQRALVVLEGALLPTGSDYEVWVLRAGGTASQGIVWPDPRGIAVLRLENVGEAGIVGGFVVSLEPKGGSPNRTAPTGRVVLTGAPAP